MSPTTPPQINTLVYNTPVVYTKRKCSHDGFTFEMEVRKDSTVPQSGLKLCCSSKLVEKPTLEMQSICKNHFKKA